MWGRLALCLLLAGGAAQADEISGARYGGPVSRYGHGVLGDTPEWSWLDLTLKSGAVRRITLPETAIFEDLAPRLADIDGDGDAEVITTESSLTAGARVSVYDETGLVAATPYIGRRNRWLAIIGVTDFDRDGQADIAYVETPHLTGTVRIVTRRGARLSEISSAAGLTNHRIGDAEIFGGIRECGEGPEMILAGFPWTATSPLVALRLTASDHHLRARRFARPATRDNARQALRCTLMPEDAN